jgi:uncharacterized protein (DUF2235 family)
VRHAVSIDERRCFFRQNLMGRSDPTQDVKNVWFAGVHSDVGGGYAAAEAGLSKLAFEWMMVEASSHGFKIDPGGPGYGYAHELTLGQAPDPCGMLHQSLHGAWYGAEILPTRHFSIVDEKYHWRMNLGQPRNMDVGRTLDGVFLHESVLKRMDLVSTYRPKNLPKSSVAVRTLYKIEPQVQLAQARSRAESGNGPLDPTTQ